MCFRIKWDQYVLLKLKTIRLTQRSRGEFQKRCSWSRIMGIMRPLSHIRYFKDYSASLLASLLHNQVSNGQWYGDCPDSFLAYGDTEYRSSHRSFGECCINSPLSVNHLSHVFFCQNQCLPLMAHFLWVMRLWKEDIKGINGSGNFWVSWPCKFWVGLPKHNFSIWVKWINKEILKQWALASTLWVWL